MRGRGVIAGVLAACGAVALSVPAHADQYDFISQLDNLGVSYESMIDMIDIGKELCHDLRSGVTPLVVLGKLQATGFAPAESAHRCDGTPHSGHGYGRFARVERFPSEAFIPVSAETIPCCAQTTGVTTTPLNPESKSAVTYPAWYPHFVHR